MNFDDKLASSKLHDFAEYCNLQRQMADLRACPLDELVCRFAAFKSRGFDMSGYRKYDLGLSIMYHFLRQRDDWFGGVDHFAGNNAAATVLEHARTPRATGNIDC